ncbi:MAG TPA: hypothetical protein DCY13_09115 [Verrucomicrobiales bacterium]|nr:hypothetical protein [Verrucomicrobiales bacterium]
MNEETPTTSAPDSRQSWLRRPLCVRHWVWLSAGMLGIIAMGLAYYARFESFEICTNCGRQRQVVNWEVPFVHRTMVQFFEVHETALSHVLLQLELQVDHEHSWQHVFGSGNGSPLVFGTSRPIASVFSAPASAAFLQEVARHEGRSVAAAWFADFSNPARAEYCRSVAELMLNQQFADRDAFRAWLERTESDQRHFLAY